LYTLDGILCIFDRSEGFVSLYVNFIII